ncbi:SDR family NAD(P)-dependent oxidoreductase [Lichenifustis flavocetrariae]|uniref:SDR family NAD(P)-dependent oxidoreductase n=1 Tax=Lichenifustis flavocetrariae TaxID=2949735 RepID=A0AA41YTF3_9HYPH|nr:SDR family NAD(P)-dependent oxidoreductase [Lichenifustis flavocetrariae]MCW6508256.1 SDR family NAD(P)-dependent oxidoreductase [Lichenifustis flavocetrariae]
MSAEGTGRVVMISGANRGIGAAIARHLDANDWQLSLGVRSPTAMDVPPGGSDTLVQAYDARDRGSQTAWVEATVARFGRIDAVVANAGILIPKSVIEAEDHEIDDVYEVNVKAPMRLVRAAWPWLSATGCGRVINVVSLSGKRVASAQSGLYATSKFATLALTHAIRQAGWDKGIRATAICPGFVATDMAAAAPGRPDQLTQPDDIGRIVAFVLDLPNTASVAEIPINWALEPAL